MKCYDCPYYRNGYMYNSCALAQAECFIEPDNCNLVHDDGSLNYDDEFIKMEYGEKSKFPVGKENVWNKKYQKN